MSRLLPPGSRAPEFRLLDQRAVSVALTDFPRVALVCFSSHWLPGDLALLRRWMAAYPRLQAVGWAVLGLSGVNWESLHHLAHRLDCPFPLLFDPCCRQSKALGAMWIPKFVTGRAVFAFERLPDFPENPGAILRYASRNQAPEALPTLPVQAHPGA